MTQPAPKQETPAESEELVLAPGAYGDPTKPGLSRKEYEEIESPETPPTNPSSDPVPVVDAGGDPAVSAPTSEAPTDAAAPQAPAVPAAS